MQIGLEQCQGDYVSWAADDGYYMPNSIDVAFKSLEGSTDERTYVIGKYQEGGDGTSVPIVETPHVMNSINYYYVNTHDGSRSRFIPNDCLMVMVGVLPRKLLFEIGGWDASLFEVCPMAFADLSVRIHNMCCPRIFQEERMFRCGHMPGHEGDHGPIHDAQVEHDEPLFRKIYHERASQNRNIIPLDNWKQSPPIWERRFGKVDNIDLRAY
jgi:hypothetical protein